MSKRNQPYLPLYVQDFLTDEKLMECSASATGIYIRIMCIMHKSEQYGKILLKQKYKQNNEQNAEQNVKQIKNFASYLLLFMPYKCDEIESALHELISSDVLQLDGDYLCQKRMIKDANISAIRSISGSKGGKKSQELNKKPIFENDFASSFAKAKVKANSQANIKANTENENDIDIENEYVNNKINKWNKTKKVFLNNSKWKNEFITAKNINLQELETFMNEFITSLELKLDYKPIAALRKHFFNYYNKMKQNEADKRNNTKPKFGVAIREAGSRMGAIGDSFGKEIA